MDYNKLYEKQKGAALFAGKWEDLPPKFAEWDISDSDAYYANLDVWCPKDADPIEMMFSDPACGIKQHLANKISRKVGVAGECLINEKLFDALRNKYLDLGYEVIDVQNDSIRRVIKPTPALDNVFIVWHDSDKKVKQQE